MRSDDRRFDARPPWAESPERVELHARFAEADALMAGISCDASTDCCRFGVTGREPYVTPAEVAEIRGELRAQGRLGKSERPPSPKKHLPLSGERRCPMLSDAGRCTVYEARPLGCRTFFCRPALAQSGNAKLPQVELRRLAREVDEISRRAFPGESGTRPITRVLGT